ncbi:MAG: Hsp20/alpha crystallin family protein [Gemmataceae bacterium]
MSKDLIRLMHVLFLPGAEACQTAPWQPNTDVYRTPAGWLIKFELAGVRADDIDLQVLGGRMTLRGVRRDCVLESPLARDLPRLTHDRMEIAYSGFERTLELPCDLRRADITTDFRDGMLLVRIIPTA